jgi:ATP-binding cassette subfamily C (CFTR/MRP) protein 4
LQVLHEGTIAEFDEPYLLLQSPEGMFRKMVDSTGEQECTLLTNMAHECFVKKHGQDYNIEDYIKTKTN